MGRWENGTFDIVVDGHCLHCIIGDDRSKVLKERFRVLKPDGMFYGSTMCGEPKEPEVIKMFDAETRCMVWDGVARRYIGGPEDILKEIEGIGFKIIKQEIQAGKDTEDNLSLLVKK